MFYENSTCDGCGQPLLECEDIVVCPDCGTPQHRACYELNNKCVNEHLHAEGFEWKNPNPPEPVNPFQNEQPQTEEAPPFSEQVPVGMPVPAIDVNPIFFEKAGVSPDAEFDGVKVKDAVSYTQVSAKHYLKKFIRTDGKKHFISWNWGAFFFAPAWFFYRKLYKLGFIFLGIIVALNLFLMPQYEKVNDSYEEMQTTYTEYGEAIKTYNEDNSAENEAALAEKEAAVQKLARELMPAMSAYFIGTFLAPNVAAALIADGFYKRKMLEDIKTAYSSTQDTKIIKYSLLRRGGVAIFAAMAALLAQSYLPSIIFDIVKNITLR